MTDQDRPATTPRQRAIEAYEGAREKAAGSLSEAPLLALAGGLAAGALIAALLPRTKAETRALKPAVRQVRKTAKAAVQAARETGSDKLNELGLTREKGEETIRSLFQGVTDAAKASGQAAVDTIKNQR
jgi:hypothetical protein